MTVSLSDAIFLGQKAASMELDDALAVSRVNIDVDSDNYYTAGTDTGAIVNVSCPWGSEAMAQSVLAAMSAYTYRPYTATDALLDPAAELGDAVTVGGVYSIIASLDIDYNRASVAEIAAPGLDEIDDEYPYITQERKETNKVLAQARSIIRKTAEEIELAVEGEIEGINNTVTSLKVTLDGVTITDDTGTTKIRGSSIETETLYVDAAHINGQLTANQIDATNLKVNAANITGSLTIGQLPSNVATDNDIPTKTSDLYNDSGYQTRSGVVNIIDGTVTADYVEALEVAAATLRGRTIYVQNYSGSSVGYISTSSADTGGSAIDINSYGAGRFVANSNLYFSGAGVVLQLGGGNIQCGRSIVASNDNTYNLGSSGIRWANAYVASGVINSSDRNQKTDISYDLSKYDAIFDALKPASFKFIDGTSGRTHTGFISQDVEDSLALCGLTSIDFATFIKSPKVDEDGKVIEGEYVYGLRYDELIALMVTQIQSLKKRVADLEVAYG